MKSPECASAALIAAIRLYQRVLSPCLARIGVRCRFHPTCSEYSIQAIRKYGLRLGLRKTWNRLRRCNRYNLETCIDFP